VPPFHQDLRKAFEWSDEYEEAFFPVEEVPNELPLPSKTVPGKVLYLYLAVSPTAISAALI
jgi:hypothetical protein